MTEPLHFLPESASQSAIDVDRLGLALLAITTLFSIGIALAILLFISRYWHTREVNRDFQPSATMHWLVESVWSLGPLTILLSVFFWGAAIYVRHHRPPANPLQINVVAKQWMWKVAHPAGRREINSLHVPTGRPVRLTMISEDVIHSFFVPAFRLKQDVLPARYTTLWFQANRPGTYHLFCAEYCGTDHSKMIGKIVAMQPENYSDWSASGDAQTPPQRGRELIETLGCLQCHSVVNGTQLGPSLTGLWGSSIPLRQGERVIADETYLRRSILQPASQIHEGFEARMPSYEGKIDPAQMLDILAYLRSIADTTSPIAGPGRSDRPLGGPTSGGESTLPPEPSSNIQDSGER